MGKHTVNDENNQNSSELPYDCELKELIDKCNVCHSNLNAERDGKLCKHHRGKN